MSQRSVTAVLRLALAIGATGAVVAAVASFRPSSRGHRTAAATPVVRLPVQDAAVPPGRIAHRMAILIHDPFRRNRLAPSTRYDGVLLEAARLAPPAPQAPRPTLTLVGVLWAATPAALIDGIPGSDGSRLLHPGDTLGGIRLRSLTGDRAVVSARDTTWTLLLRKAAQ